MLSLAGGLLVEISLPKLIMAWTLLLLVPGLLLGLGPIVASEWVRALSGTVAAPAIGIWSVLCPRCRSRHRLFRLAGAVPSLGP